MNGGCRTAVVAAAGVAGAAAAGRRRAVGGGYAPYYGNWYRGGWGNSSAFWSGFGVGALTSFGLGSLFGVGYGGYGAYGVTRYGYSGDGSVQLPPDLGREQLRRLGPGLVRDAPRFTAATPIRTTRRWSRPLPAQTTVVYDYSQPINVTQHAAGSVGRREHRAGLLGRPRLVQGRRLSACTRSDRPGLEANARRRGRARVSCALPLRAQALRRSGRRSTTRSSRPGRAGTGRRWSAFIPTSTPTPISFALWKRTSRAIPARRPASSCWRTITWPRAITTRPVLGFKKWSSLCRPTSSRRDSPSSTRRRPRLRPRPRRPPNLAPAGQAAQPGARASRPAGCSAGQPVRVGESASRRAPATAPPSARDDQPPPPPASLVGVWKAQASPDVSIALTLEADGKFAWEVDTKGKKQTLNGIAGFKDDTLALLQHGWPAPGRQGDAGRSQQVRLRPRRRRQQSPRADVHAVNLLASAPRTDDRACPST